MFLLEDDWITSNMAEILTRSISVEQVPVFPRPRILDGNGANDPIAKEKMRKTLYESAKFCQYCYK